MASGLIKGSGIGRVICEKLCRWWQCCGLIPFILKWLRWDQIDHFGDVSEIKNGVVAGLAAGARREGQKDICLWPRPRENT